MTSIIEEFWIGIVFGAIFGVLYGRREDLFGEIKV